MANLDFDPIWFFIIEEKKQLPPTNQGQNFHKIDLQISEWMFIGSSRLQLSFFVLSQNQFKSNLIWGSKSRASAIVSVFEYPVELGIWIIISIQYK